MRTPIGSATSAGPKDFSSDWQKNWVIIKLYY
jgi:hypothetical protein